MSSARRSATRCVTIRHQYELLDNDPLCVANEGRFVADPPGRVLGPTAFGGHLLIDMLVGARIRGLC